MALFAIPVVPPHAIATAATSPVRPAPVLIDARHVDAAPRQESSGQRQATPSIVYEQAMEHAADRIAWQPGGRVSVGFSPRSDDGWVVGGAAPRRLPAGRATGREMAATGQGDSWAAVATTGNRTTASAVSVQPQATGLRRQVFGFLPYWEVASAASTLNYNVLSTIAYFSVGVDSSGNLRKRNSDGTTTTGWGGWTSANMTQVINAAHLKHTRVVLTLSVFAWTTSQATTQKAILGNATARLNLARQTAAAVRDRGADGVNLDFEPLATGYEAQFVSFVKTLRSELDAIAPGYQITFDTTGYIGNYPLAAATAPGAADAVFVMGYDYRTSGSGYAGSIDPAAGPGYDLADTIRAYSGAVPASKLILGLPWYGRAWSTTAGTLNARNQSGTKYGASVAVNYESVVGLAAQYGRHWDSRELSSWLAYQRQNCTTTHGCVTSWREVYYDDTTALRARYDLVNAYGLRGAGIWALGYEGGRAEMWKALADKFLNDTTPPDAGVVIPPSREVDEGFVIRWTAADDSSVVSYDVQVSVDGGAWTTWLAGTSATSDVYLGRDGHGYAFRVRARDSKGNLSSWNVSSVYDATPTVAVGGFARVTLDGLAYRTGPDTSAQRLGTLNAGTIVAISGGPVSADGYTWWEVTQPIREWGPVSFVERGVWIAGRSATASNVAAYRAPNSTLVDAGLVDFTPGDAVGSLGAATASARAVSPNGDGTRDTLRLRWTNSVALDGLTLNVLKTDGTVVGSRPVAALAAGQHAWDWDAAVTSSALPDGSYLLQLVGKSGTTTYRAPSSRPATATQVASYAVKIDTVPPAISSAVVTSDVISPNGDGYRDALGLSLAASDAASWTVTVRDGSGATVRTMSGSGSTTTLAWGGKADDGSPVAGDAYRVAAPARGAAGKSAPRAPPGAGGPHAAAGRRGAGPA